MKVLTIAAIGLMSASVSFAQEVVTVDELRTIEDCATINKKSISIGGLQGSQSFFETYSHRQDDPLYVSSKSRIEIFTNGASLSCVDADSWKRLSEVIPNDGTAAISFSASCDVSVPVLPHSFQITFLTRYGVVTENGNATAEKQYYTHDGDGFHKHTISYSNYFVENYRESQASCLNIVIE